ncbi:hypothetical protein KCP78_18060 [Salmonella enterica subsp. enterica]|nr:hypothetical protein KCP78_18060 [Salmonella enterica subsp. enterica]
MLIEKTPHVDWYKPATRTGLTEPHQAIAANGCYCNKGGYDAYAASLRNDLAADHCWHYRQCDRQLAGRDRK